MRSSVKKQRNLIILLIDYDESFLKRLVACVTGFMLPNEQKVIEGMTTTYNKYFVPLVWSASLVSRARKEGRIKDDFAVKTLIDVSSKRIPY